MRSIVFAALVAGFAYWCRRYSDALSSIVGTHGSGTLIAAAVAGFFPPWLMGRAFMTSQEARRIAAELNSRPDYYDFERNRTVRNPRDADPEGIKVQYLLASLVAWFFQVFVIYKAFFYR